MKVLLDNIIEDEPQASSCTNVMTVYILAYPQHLTEKYQAHEHLGNQDYLTCNGLYILSY